MASEREQARETYLAIREQALKVDKKARMTKLWVDLHYMLSGAFIIGSLIYLFSQWANMEGSQKGISILICVVITGVWIALGAIPTKKNLATKKEMHDLRQKMDDLESKYHL